MPVIRSASAPSPHQQFFWQYGGTADNPQWAVRDGDWKLLHSPVQAKPGDLNEEKLMLINLKANAGENKNEAGAHPEIVKSMMGQYQSWVKEVGNQ